MTPARDSLFNFCRPAKGEALCVLNSGHYVAGSKGKSPILVLGKDHDRSVSLHLKDRTTDGGNVPWGQGQTPIRKVPKLMRKEKCAFPAEGELEYGSTTTEGSAFTHDTPAAPAR